MAELVEVYRDILTKIRAELPGFLTVNVWNNQTKQEADGQYIGYPKPALFIEVIKDPEIGALPQGVSSSDVGVIFHIVHEFTNDGDNFEQNLAVFDFTKQVLQAFTLYKAPGCGPMALVNEAQDQEHTQIYEYVLGFVAHFIDTTALIRGVDAVMPTEVIIGGTFIEPKNYIIPSI